MNFAEAVDKYQRLKGGGHDKEASGLKNSIANAFKAQDGSSIVFNNEQQSAGLLDVLFDTGKIFSISWIRKTNSKSPDGKKAGEVDVMTIKKPQGYVKGTSEGKKQAENIINGRVAIWVCDGKLRDDGFGNWRTIYAKDITSITYGKSTVGVQFSNAFYTEEILKEA